MSVVVDYRQHSIFKFKKSFGDKKSFVIFCKCSVFRFGLLFGVCCRQIYLWFRYDLLRFYHQKMTLFYVTFQKTSSTEMPLLPREERRTISMKTFSHFTNFPSFSRFSLLSRESFLAKYGKT